MTMSTTDFWGEISPATFRTPISILREQASLLGPKTKNLVEAEVSTSSHDGVFYHTMYLIAPGLDNYRYQLLRVSHQIGLYPVSDFYSPAAPLRDEEAFVKWLQAKLSSAETKKIIEALLAQLEAA